MDISALDLLNSFLLLLITAILGFTSLRVNHKINQINQKNRTYDVLSRLNRNEVYLEARSHFAQAVVNNKIQTLHYSRSNYQENSNPQKK